MAKREFDDDSTEGGAAAAASATATVDKGRYPGDILRDKKTGKKAKFVNEYGTNGRAIIVIPEGMKRSELWDANSVEIIKKAKRPTAPAPLEATVSPAGLDDEEEEVEEDESDDS